MTNLQLFTVYGYDFGTKKTTLLASFESPQVAYNYQGRVAELFNEVYTKQRFMEV